jgi:hypothetical protein
MGECNWVGVEWGQVGVGMQRAPLCYSGSALKGWKEWEKRMERKILKRSVDEFNEYLN